MTFTHTERKTLKHVNNGVIVPLDLRNTLEDLKARGHIKTKSVRNGIPQLYVVQTALDEIHARTPAVDPKRINRNTGTLIDKDE